MDETAIREKRQQELPDLAYRLGFANALIIDLKKELSQLRVQAGKDAAYIAELEDKNKILQRELDDPLRGKKISKLADMAMMEHWKKRLTRMMAMVKAMRLVRDKALSELNNYKSKQQ